MKFTRLFMSFLIVSNTTQATIDVFSIASNFKSQDLAIPVTAINRVGAVATIGIFGWKAKKSFNKFEKLHNSRSRCYIQLIKLQNNLVELSKSKDEQIIILNAAHKKYLESKTKNEWDEYFKEQTILVNISMEIQKKESSLLPLKSEFTQLSVEMANARASCINNFFASVAPGIMYIGYGLWRFFGKNNNSGI
jgi:uncharacterized protein (DUF342 family)